ACSTSGFRAWERISHGWKAVRRFSARPRAEPPIAFAARTTHMRPMVVRVLAVVIAFVFAAAATADEGAPRIGDRFVNFAGPRPRAPVHAMVPFLARKVWTSLAGRTGGARLVPFDPAALQENPSITWIGHATFLVRMDGVTF